MRTLISMAAMTLILAFSNYRADAAVLSFDYSFEYTGAQTPTGPAPWLRATFDDEGTAGSVNFTLQALNLTGGEFVSRAFFNLDPALNANDLVFTPSAGTTGTFNLPAIQTGSDSVIAGGGARFDIQFSFAMGPPQDRFGAGDSVSYAITGIPTLTANSFDFLSVGGGQGSLPTSAHVQGISGDGSGWVTIPEPAALGLLAIAGVALLRRRS